MGAFYSSAKGSTVMQIKTIPTPPEDYTGTYDSSRPYDASGWCIFEECTAQLVTGTEALNAHRLGLLREPLALFTAYVRPVLLVLLAAIGSDAGESRGALRGEQELAAQNLVDGVNALARPKLIDISDVERPREAKLCAAAARSSERQNVATVPAHP